jgi:hypothetical protein
MAGAQSTQQTTSPHGKNAIVDSTSRHILHSLCCRSCLFSSINDSISSITIKKTDTSATNTLSNQVIT